MPDNLTTDAGVLATRDRGGAHVSRVVLTAVGSTSATDVSPATAEKQDDVKASVDGLAPAHRWFAITPGTSNLGTVPDSLYVSVAGDLVVRGSDGVDATFKVLAGQILPIRPTQVRTGTTATVIGLVN